MYSRKCTLRFFTTLVTCSVLFTVAAFGQDSKEGKAGTQGAMGSAGNHGANGEVAYLVLRNDLDLDARLLSYAHKDYLKIVNNRERYDDQQISNFLTVKADEILNYSNGCPTLGSDQRDRLFLICFAANQGYVELMSAIKSKGFTMFPSEASCRSLIRDQKLATHGNCK